MASVIVHPEFGIFLGTALGLAFWSKIDPVGQPCAPTFANMDQAQELISAWTGEPLTGWALHEVIPDDGTYASVMACAAAGLEPWQDEQTPVANHRPC
jgi:hypothetical protein